MNKLTLSPPEVVEGCVCEDVKTEDLKEIFEEQVPQMLEILKESGGIGLAAPQVGIMKKFFLAMDEGKGEIKIIINPKYFKNGSKTTTNEGCLTYGLKKYTPVKRWKSITLIHDDLGENNELVQKRQSIRGNNAVIYQHETDHLSGITIFNKKK